MAYNSNKSPQPFGGGRGGKSDGSTPNSYRVASSSPLPTAPRMNTSANSPSPPTVMLRRQLLSPGANSPQSSPCPSPVAGRLRPHSIALAESSNTSSQQQQQPSYGKFFFHLAISCTPLALADKTISSLFFYDKSLR